MTGKARKLQTSLYFKKLKIEIRVFCKKTNKNPNSAQKTNQGKKQQTKKKLRGFLS